MRILVFVKYYLPGYKAGGPLKSIQGLVDNLGDDLKFSIVATDRDFGDTERFPGIEIHTWTKVGQSQVCYTERVTRSKLSQILQTETWDLLYLQSFFDPNFTLKPLLWWKSGLLKARKVLVAPRGEFSPGAIRLDATKKKTFLLAARFLRFYRDVYWQASSERERQDILREIPRLAPAERIFVASDIPPKPLPIIPSEINKASLAKNRLRVLFLSRITRMKNLEFAIDVLAKLSFPVEFNIYGPIDHADYWEACRKQIEALPSHIQATYHGPIPPPQVPATFDSHDVFLLPTRGENFGHVVFESIQCGCPVLLSDQTPWQDLQNKKVGWILPINDTEAFQKVLQELESETEAEKKLRRERCIEYAKQFVAAGEDIKRNRSMFESLGSN